MPLDLVEEHKHNGKLHRVGGPAQVWRDPDTNEYHVVYFAHGREYDDLTMYVLSAYDEIDDNRGSRPYR